MKWRQISPESLACTWSSRSQLGTWAGSGYQKSLNDPGWLQHTLAWYCSDFSFNSPDFYQPVLDQLKAQVLILRRLVLGEGVVHVEPIELDLLQSKGTVDENPGKRTCCFLCERYILLNLGCKVMPAIRIIKMPLMIGRLQHLQTRN